MEKFRTRPGYGSKNLLIEFWGDHRSKHFPNIQNILLQGLKSRPLQHPELDVAKIAMATDEVISFWVYENGEYELDDDIWAFFIHAQDNNERVIADIENVLLESGQFFKEDVDLSEYE